MPPNPAPSSHPRVELRERTLPTAVRSVCRGLGEAGHRAWLVGGCVRDSLLAQRRGSVPPGRWVTKDWDVATDATPRQVMGCFRKVIPTGIDHGTVTVVLQGTPLEVTTLRVEEGYRDGRRPDEVKFVTSIEADLARRDFTVNAIAFSPADDELIAPHGGLEDLSARCLRAVGDPAKRFEEDGLRVLRAARFVATLEFELEPATRAAIAPSLESYRQVSAERIRDEWNKALAAREPSRAYHIMADHGLLEITAPELHGLAPAALASHLRAVDRLRGNGERWLEVKLSGLLAGLSPTSEEAADAADAVLERLRYSNAQRQLVDRLIRHQQLPRPPLDGPALRTWLHRVQPDLVEPLCELARARAESVDVAAAVDALARQAERQLGTKPPLSLRDLAIGGKQLMGEAGIEPGPHLGRILQRLLLAVIRDPSLNTHSELLRLARQEAEAPER